MRFDRLYLSTFGSIDLLIYDFVILNVRINCSKFETKGEFGYSSNALNYKESNIVIK